MWSAAKHSVSLGSDLHECVSVMGFHLASSGLVVDHGSGSDRQVDRTYR